MKIGDREVEDVKIGWLAGVIDVNASLYMSLLHKEKTRANLTTRLEFSSVFPKCIDEVSTILEMCGITYSLSDPKYQPKSTMPAKRLCIKGKEDLRELLLLINPYLIVKKYEAEQILLYLKRSCLDKRYHPTKEDFDLYVQLKDFKKGVKYE